MSEQYKREIEQVKQLGDRIGYGNMMSIASALWALHLKTKYGITSGAFVPTIRSFMKKREAVKAEKELNQRIEFFVSLGIKD